MVVRYFPKRSTTNAVFWGTKRTDCLSTTSATAERSTQTLKMKPNISVAAMA